MCGDSPRGRFHAVYAIADCDPYAVDDPCARYVVAHPHPFQMALRCAIAAFAAAVAVAAPPKVALYVGPGSSAGSGGNLTASLKALAAAGTIASVDLFTAGADVASKLTRSSYDLVVFPGGGGGAEATGIGADGAAAVKCVGRLGGRSRAAYWGRRTSPRETTAPREATCFALNPGFRRTEQVVRDRWWRLLRHVRWCVGCGICRCYSLRCCCRVGSCTAGITGCHGLDLSQHPRSHPSP